MISLTKFELSLFGSRCLKNISNLVSKFQKCWNQILTKFPAHLDFDKISVSISGRKKFPLRSWNSSKFDFDFEIWYLNWIWSFRECHIYNLIKFRLVSLKLMKFGLILRIKLIFRWFRLPFQNVANLPLWTRILNTIWQNFDPDLGIWRNFDFNTKILQSSDSKLCINSLRLTNFLLSYQCLSKFLLPSQNITKFPLLTRYSSKFTVGSQYLRIFFAHSQNFRKFRGTI